MMIAAVKPLNMFPSDNLLKSRDTALDCRVPAYDILFKAREFPFGHGV